MYLCSRLSRLKPVNRCMNNEIQFILYHLPNEEGKVQVVIKDETIWATQKAMAQLFGVGVPAISKHLTHIFDEGELDKDTTVSKMEIVVNRGFRGEVKEDVEFYSLDAIIAVGYRVSSARATKFRQWATKILNEYSTMPSLGRRPQKLYSQGQTTKRNTWGCRRGRTRLTEECC